MGLCVCEGVSPSQDRVPNWGITEGSTTVVGAGVGSAGKEGIQDGEGGWRQGAGHWKQSPSLWLFGPLTQAAA